jgi:hypothetical protein
MKVTLPFNKFQSEPKLSLGPRLEFDIKKRIHELENRFPGALTRADRGELQRLKDLLRLGGGQ